MIEIKTAEQLLQGDDTHGDALQAVGIELLAEVKRLRKQVEALFSEIRRLEGDDGEWINEDEGNEEE